MDLLLTQLEEMKARFDQSGGLSASDEAFIRINYEHVLSKPFRARNCGQCYRDAFIEMYIHAKQNGIKEMGQFILKREEVLHINQQVYTRINMTDEVAAEYLKQYPAAIGKFEVYPRNWEETIAENKPEKPTAKKRTAKK